MRKPVVQVIGQSDSDLIPKWGSSLLAVRFTDNEGGDADEIEFDFSVALPLQAPPAEGTRYRLLYGWEAGALKDAGSFTYQNSRISFSADHGWVLTITARSADFVDADKAEETEHFEDLTAGEIFSRLAASAGKSAKVHPSIANIKIPYRLRMQQSAVGFAQALADELGGTLKPANGQWLVTEKNSGQTAGGSIIPPLVVSIEDLIGCDLNHEAKAKYGQVGAGYFDADQGLSLLELVPGLGKAASMFSLFPAASGSEATVRSKAEATALARATITGSVTIEGDPAAMAGAPVQLIGFGGWSGRDLVAQTITHEFTFDEQGGWLMTPELAAKS